MAKVGKLSTKLKSAIKRWPSLSSKLRRSSSSNIDDKMMINNISKEHHDKPEPRRAVFVGKSRRRYLLSADIICHPLFQDLIDRSSTTNNINIGDEEEEEEEEEVEVLVVACEVVFFEHLLWMLQTGSGSQLGSTEELVEFYTTC